MDSDNVYGTECNIRYFREEDLSQANSLLTCAFFSKINSLLDIDLSDAAGLMTETGFFRKKPVEGYFVMEKDGKIAGVMLLKYPGQKKGGDDFRLMPVFRRYGIIKALKFLAGVLLLENKAKSGECYIEYIAIGESYRGLGLGSAFLAYAEDFAINKGFSQLTLCVVSSNRARDFYRRLGFIEKEEKSSLLTHFFLGIEKWTPMVKDLSKKAE
ncbi:MAG: GNAT family N-acetyltransferase [Methanomicrobiaceae archaeon]|nr:GNAT family N-acetyltransferase [Methanomicrobiaceae archaeon]